MEGNAIDGRFSHSYPKFSSLVEVHTDDGRKTLASSEVKNATDASGAEGAANLGRALKWGSVAAYVLVAVSTALLFGLATITVLRKRRRSASIPRAATREGIVSTNLQRQLKLLKVFPKTAPSLLTFCNISNEPFLSPSQVRHRRREDHCRSEPETTAASPRPR